MPGIKALIFKRSKIPMKIISASKITCLSLWLNTFSVIVDKIWIGKSKTMPLFPNGSALATVSTNINILSALLNIAAELFVIIVVPNFFKRLGF